MNSVNERKTRAQQQIERECEFANDGENDPVDQGLVELWAA